MNIKYAFKKVLNHIVPKSKNRIYVCPHENGRIDKYDLINYSSDNSLSFLNYLNKVGTGNDIVFYVECFSKTRIELIQKKIKNWRIKIVPILSKRISEDSSTSMIRALRNNILKYRCCVWITCTPHSNYKEKTKSQKILCLNYSTPFKTGLSENRRIDYCKWLDHLCETSLLTASIHAAQYHNYIVDAPIIGFARNDNLFGSPKKEMVIDWLKSCGVGQEVRGILVYAPTYREYEGAFSNGCVLGYNISPRELESFLKENKLYIIVKMHPWQNDSSDVYTEHVIKYENTFEFSLYDVLFVSDMLISDYSSVIHDYLLTDKPIVMDMFDYELYRDSRGFAFEPIDYICPGDICCSFDEMKRSILKELSASERSKKYYMVKQMFHKYSDAKSAERTWEFLKTLIN